MPEDASLLADIKAQLDKLTKRTAHDDDGDGDYDEDRAPSKVPYSRFQRVAAERKALREALEEIRSQVEQMESDFGAEVERLTNASKEAEKLYKQQVADEVAKLGRQHSEDLAMVDLGIKDPLGRKVARDAYSMLPEDGRPKSVVDYLNGIKQQYAAHAEYMSQPKADPAKAPALPDLPLALSPYIAPPAPPALPPKAKAPGVDRGVLEGPPPGVLERPASEFGSMAEFKAALREASGDT